MLRQTSILRFCLIVLAVFLLLMLPWPGLRRGYARVFQTLGDLTFLVSPEAVEFQAHRSGIDAYDTRIEYTKSGQPGWSRLVDSRVGGYVPTALFLSLVIATPLTRRRRRRALLWGGLMLHAYIYARLGMLLLWATPPTSWWEGTLFYLSVQLNYESTIYATVPVIIWLLVSFPDCRWEEAVTSCRSEGHPPPSGAP